MRTIPILLKLAILCFACLFATAHAGAQAGASDKAAAEALFDQGMALMAKSQFTEACKRFERSQAVDPGLGTMLYLADCYERVGRTASAWALFREAASMASAAGQQERAAAGASRAASLKPKLSYLTVSVAKANRVQGITVHRGDSLLADSLWGIALPVDPGDHILRVEAPGFVSLESTVSVAGDGAQVSFDAPRLVASAAPQDEAPPSVPPSLTPSGPVESDIELNTTESTEAPGSTQRVVGLIVAGAGGVSVAVGAAFGIHAIAQNRKALDSCDSELCSTSQGVDFTDKARSAANVSTVMWTAGVALITGGLITYWLAPDEEAPAVTLAASPDSAMLQLGGAF